MGALNLDGVVGRTFDVGANPVDRHPHPRDLLAALGNQRGEMRQRRHLGEVAAQRLVHDLGVAHLALGGEHGQSVQARVPSLLELGAVEGAKRPIINHLCVQRVQGAVVDVMTQ